MTKQFKTLITTIVTPLNAKGEPMPEARYHMNNHFIVEWEDSNGPQFVSVKPVLREFESIGPLLGAEMVGKIPEAKLIDMFGDDLEIQYLNTVKKNIYEIDMAERFTIPYNQLPHSNSLEEEIQRVS